MRYEIGVDNAVMIYANAEDEKPFWLQPHYPNGESFDTAEEAETWAKAAVASHEDETAPYPPDGKGLVGQKKPTKEEMFHARLESIGMSVEDLKKVLGL
jgi:hypothetical protein